MSPGTPAAREQWIDISVGLHDGMVHWPDNPPVQIGLVLAIDQGAVRNPITHLPVKSELIGEREQLAARAAKKEVFS